MYVNREPHRNGDASIEAAKKAGGITEVTHIDWEAKVLNHQ